MQFNKEFKRQMQLHVEERTKEHMHGGQCVSGPHQASAACRAPGALGVLGVMAWWRAAVRPLDEGPTYLHSDF